MYSKVSSALLISVALYALLPCVVYCGFPFGSTCNGGVVIQENPHYHYSPFYRNYYGQGPVGIANSAPSGSVAVADSIISGAPSVHFPHYGHHHGATYVPGIGHVHAHGPSRRVVNVQVGVNEPQPGYAIVPPRDSYRPSRVIINEKVKLPSVAVKEREAVVVGADHHHHHHHHHHPLYPGHYNTIVKKFDYGC